MAHFDREEIEEVASIFTPISWKRRPLTLGWFYPVPFVNSENGDTQKLGSIQLIDASSSEAPPQVVLLLPIHFVYPILTRYS